MTSAVRWAQRLAVVAALVMALLAWRAWQSANGLSTTEAAQRMLDSVEGTWWAAPAFVGAYLVRPLVLFPASIVTVVAGVLFGPWWGVAIVVVAANASAMVAYGIGRILGPDGPPSAPTSDVSDVGELDQVADGADAGVPSADRGHDQDSGVVIARWGERLRARSFETVVVMRLLFLPYDLVNYVCGVLRIRPAPFAIATALGSLPGTISFVLLGASLDRVDEGLGGIDLWAIIAGVAILVGSVVASRVVAKRTG